MSLCQTAVCVCLCVFDWNHVAKCVLTCFQFVRKPFPAKKKKKIRFLSSLGFEATPRFLATPTVLWPLHCSPPRLLHQYFLAPPSCASCHLSISQLVGDDLAASSQELWKTHHPASRHRNFPCLGRRECQWKKSLATPKTLEAPSVDCTLWLDGDVIVAQSATCR